MITSREINLVQSLLDWGVVEFHVCAGARNLPIIQALLQLRQEKYISIYNHFEERSAAFYAVGRIKSLQKPVAVVTTSGTAVAECLPAVMECHYAHLPLVVVSADRPVCHRGSGSPQSCEQKNMFGIYASCFDLTDSTSAIPSFSLLSKNQPIHVNVCIDFSRAAASEKRDTFHSLESFLNKVNSPLVVVSKIDTSHQGAVLDFLLRLQLPVYVESISNLRNTDALAHLRITCGDFIWKSNVASGYGIDGILKIGSTPTHRLWRDLDEKYPHLPVFSLANSAYPGLPGISHKNVDSPNFWNDFKPVELTCTQREKIRSFLNHDHLYHEKTKQLLKKYPLSEQSIFHTLSVLIPNASSIFLGNSLSIRNWDAYATHKENGFLIEANRGLNGIDGQLSTFYGFANEQTQNWAILGDLTTLYDLIAPWSLQHNPNISSNLVIINNAGGKIFEKVIASNARSLFLNTHQLHFKHWAQMWGLSYRKIGSKQSFSKWISSFRLDQVKKTKSCHTVFEIIPDAKQTKEFDHDLSLL